MWYFRKLHIFYQFCNNCIVHVCWFNQINIFIIYQKSPQHKRPAESELAMFVGALSVMLARFNFNIFVTEDTFARGYFTDTADWWTGFYA